MNKREFNKYEQEELLPVVEELIESFGIVKILEAIAFNIYESKPDKALEYRAIILEHTARDFKFLSQYDS